MVTAALARSLLAAHGKVKSQPAEDWTGDFPLPPAVADFYRDVGPANVTIRVGGNPFVLPRLGKLWKLQDGYRFVGRNRQRDESWDDDWLVVGDCGGDPLILSRARGTVAVAQHGSGAWEPEELFPDLNTMAACLGAIGAHAVGGEGGSILNELETLVGSSALAARIIAGIGYS